ncbi:MAG: DNA repair protein RecO [Deltaproteobacteria bacterium]|nr:DNA repair protein RecO [Deltaproteobacteria bacterium]
MAERFTDCVVIKVIDCGEADKLVTLYCPKAGKLNVIAKGAKRSKKRFVNKLEPFSHLSILYNDKYKLPLITEAALIASFLPLRRQFLLYAAATLICEHLYYWTAASDGDPVLFDWLLWSLNELSKSGAPQNTLVLFLTKLYGILGYQPDFSGCTTCGSLDPSNAPYGFQTGRGTVICRKCSREDKPAIPLAIPTIKLLDMSFKLPMAKLSRLKLNRNSNREALRMFQYYGRYLLDRDFQTWRYIL